MYFIISNAGSDGARTANARTAMHKALCQALAESGNDMFLCQAGSRYNAGVWGPQFEPISAAVSSWVNS